jgi:hypothetical protein
MKTLIVYSSQTGNTQKLAQAVHDLLGGEKTFCPIGEAPDPVGFDLVVLGFWFQAGKPDPKATAYLEKMDGTNLFLLATHGAAAKSAHALNGMKQAEAMAPSANILGTFHCQGEVNPTFLEKARQKQPPPPWISDAPEAAGHPDNADLNHLVAAVNATLPNFLA